MKAEKIVEAFATGGSEAMVCRLASIDPKTLHAWWDDDLRFQEPCHAARLDFSVRKMGEIDRAGANDWRAASWMAERHDIIGDQFGQSGHGGRRGSNISVTSNVPVPQIVEVGQRPVIVDIAPTEDVIEER